MTSAYVDGTLVHLDLISRSSSKVKVTYVLLFVELKWLVRPRVRAI